MSRATQRDLVLNRLRQGPATMWDLTVGLRILRPGARIFELRKKHTITSEFQRVQGRRVKVYTLQGADGQLKPLPMRSDAFQRTCCECRGLFESKKKHAKFCSTAHRCAFAKRQKALRGIEGQQSLEFANERLRSEREHFA